MKEKTILIIDDGADLRLALKDALQSEGFGVIEAADGDNGFALALKHKPDLILLDIKMPTVSGHEVLHKLRRDPWGKEVPVIFLTNMDDVTNIAQGIELNSDDYIIKSQETLASILKKVKQHLSGYHG